MAEHNNFTKLFRYDLWANARIGDKLDGKLFDYSRKCQDLFGHIRASQQIWYARINGQSTDGIILWPENTHTGETLSELKTMNKKWLSLIKREDNFDRVVSYPNSKGENFDTNLSDILHHLIIHGQHHRAQIASLLRESNMYPPPTDFIFFLRESVKN